MTDSERIENIIKYTGLTSNAFALKIGYDRAQTIYNVLNENRPISAKLATNICNSYPEISKAWLLTGEGEMLHQKPSQMVQEPTAEYKSAPVSDLTRALEIIASQQAAINKLSDAALSQAKSIEKMLKSKEEPNQTSKAG